MDMFGDMSTLTVFALGTPGDSKGRAEGMASVAGLGERAVSGSVNLLGRRNLAAWFSEQLREGNTVAVMEMGARTGPG